MSETCPSSLFVQGRGRQMVQGLYGYKPGQALIMAQGCIRSGRRHHRTQPRRCAVQFVSAYLL
eukprot:scaffold98328_cov35-Prasinocladus_malaysianus.AAC.1